MSVTAYPDVRVRGNSSQHWTFQRLKLYLLLYINPHFKVLPELGKKFGQYCV